MIRQATINDLEVMYAIRMQAKERMAAMGIDQWQDDQPTKKQFEEDILYKRAYVYVIDEEVVATATFQTEKEMTYESLVDLKIQAMTCHRIAVASHKTNRGIGKKLLMYMELFASQKNIQRLYVYTHPNNQPMQQLLKKLGYEPLGTIFLTHLRSKERLLYMKTLTF